jgi:phosphoglycerate dehydrogenase-like enzyme
VLTGGHAVVDRGTFTKDIPRLQVNDASGGIVDRDAIVNAIKSEQLKGYAHQ